MSTRWATPGSVLAVAAAAIGASACCAGPLLLVILGVGGAWGSRLVALEPLQPYFVAAALMFFGFAFYRLYRSQEARAPDRQTRFARFPQCGAVSASSSGSSRLWPRR